MKINYFYRNSSRFFSIERVFNTIIETISTNCFVQRFIVPYGDVSPVSLLKNMFFVSKNKSEINHITGDIHYCTLFLPSKNTILTIHDLVGIKRNSGIRKVLIWLFWYYLPIKKVRFITCISEKTKREILEFFPFAKTKTIVIYNPIQNNFRHTIFVFNKIKPRILHIGTTDNKNLFRVVNALQSIECHLRIIGELSVNHKFFLEKSRIEYSNDCNLSDEEILKEYVNCDIISFPSLYEGFGMPIIEGQAIGRPVLTSHIEPLIEIGQDAVAYVNPLDVESIKKGFEKVINDDCFRDSLIEKGLLNVLRFSPQKIVDQYIDIYKQI